MTRFRKERRKNAGLKKPPVSVTILDQLPYLWAETLECLSFFANLLHCSVLFFRRTSAASQWITIKWDEWLYWAMPASGPQTWHAFSSPLLAKCKAKPTWPQSSIFFLLLWIGFTICVSSSCHTHPVIDLLWPRVGKLSWFVAPCRLCLWECFTACPP